MIFIAMRQPLLSQVLDEVLIGELERLGPVIIAADPEHLASPANQSLLAHAEVIVTGWGSGRVGPEVLAVTPRLRGVVHTAGSVRKYVSKDCYDRGVVVSSQAWANAVPVAEYTLAMILLAAKGVFRAQRQYRAARTVYRAQTELAAFGAYDVQVGLIGASTVGRRVLGLLAPFDVRIALSDPTISAAQATNLGADLMDLDELMGSSTVVSLHAPWLPSTEGMIGRGQLASMPDGAVFINNARGALVDQTALTEELQSGRIDAILDVTWPEVPDPESPLWELPNVLLTPHIAGSSGRELQRMGASAVRETGRVLTGRPLHHGVDREHYDTLA